MAKKEIQEPSELEKKGTEIQQALDMLQRHGLKMVPEIIANKNKQLIQVSNQESGDDDNDGEGADNMQNVELRKKIEADNYVRSYIIRLTLDPEHDILFARLPPDMVRAMFGNIMLSMYKDPDRTEPMRKLLPILLMRLMRAYKGLWIKEYTELAKVVTHGELMEQNRGGLGLD